MPLQEKKQNFAFAWFLMVMQLPNLRPLMAHDLKELELTALYDLLATYTSQYTHIMRNKDKAETANEYKAAIVQLQSEINSRKSQLDTDRQQDQNLDDGLELPPALA